MQNFVGLTKTDVANFVKQQGINADGVVIKEEYSLEFDQDYIVSQDVPEGTKIGKDAKLTFVASKGADPEEHVDFPSNLKDMTKDQIEEWININKLSKTRITTVYDPVIEEGKVISYDLKNTDPKDFKRGSILQIKVSKGPQPPTQVTVEDFKGKDYGSAETWAKNKKLNIAKVEEFSDTLASGLIISQSAVAGSTIAEGSTFTVTVSKGKGIVIPDFSSMTKDKINRWIEENTANVIVKEKYSSSGKYIIEQSVESGKKIGSDEKIELTKSLGDRYDFKTEFGAESPIGQSIDAMNSRANAIKSKGLDPWFHEDSSNKPWSSSYSKGEIVSYVIEGGSQDLTRLTLGTTFKVITSKGLTVEFDNAKDFGFDTNKYKTKKVVDALAAKGIPFTLSTTNDECDLDWNNGSEPAPSGTTHIWYEGVTSINIRSVTE